MLGHRAATQRTEKRMSIRLNSAVNLEDIKAVCTEYKEGASGDEKVVTNQEGTNKYTATVNYSELDYSKTNDALRFRIRGHADDRLIVFNEEFDLRLLVARCKS